MSLPSPNQTVTAFEPTTNGFFGSSTATYGDVLFVGSAKSTSTGAISVFLRDHDSAEWAFLTEWQLGEPAGLAGYSVACDAERVVVGEPQFGASHGCIYVLDYDSTTTDPEAFFTGFEQVEPATPAGGVFGASVSISGDLIVVGAAYDPGGGTQRGRVFLYEYDSVSGWVESEVTPADHPDNGHFGACVYTDGTYIIASTPDTGNCGKVSIFTELATVWTEVEVIDPLIGTATAIGSSDGTLSAVADGSDRFLAIGDPTHGSSAGQVLLYTGAVATWAQDDIITDDAGSAGDKFGTSVLVKDTQTVYAGAPEETNGGRVVQITTTDEWATNVQTVYTPDAVTSGDYYGNCLSGYGETVIAGADADHHSGETDAGSVYAFVVGATWTDNKVYSIGCLDAIELDGTYYYLKHNSAVRSETTSYLDPGTVTLDCYVNMQIETAPLNFYGLQGYLRCRKIQLLNERYTDHKVTVEILHNYEGSGTQAETFSYSSIDAADNPWYQVSIKPAIQKTSAVKLKIMDTEDTEGTIGTGQGASFKSIAVEVGGLGGVFRVGEGVKK